MAFVYSIVSGYCRIRGWVPYRRLFRKEDGLIFRQEYLQKSEEFYEKHGGKTIMLSRFVPIVRTFAPVVAGIGNMPRGKFTMFNVAGGAVWTIGIILLGYWLGSRIPNIDRYLLPIILLAMAISFGPTVWHLAKDKKFRNKILRKLKLRD
jgi:membrane-associated protein